MITRFVALPKPAQAVIMVVCGGSIATALYYLLPGGWLFFFIIAVVLVAVMLLVYRLLLKRAKKRKAAKMQQSLSEHSAATASTAGEPAARARMDDMRRSFEDGVEKFRAVGKNLYELPWYVMVGESGGGKTEAIRHSNIGFPPGLQDRLQGVGGTISMNWWFTDNAVLLDTAGRLMFEDTAGGEWKEFLKLLKANRPSCPINGMLLIIPADSLIKDTAEDIEKKGSRIAQQLDNIQRELGVRFPVFVAITKCDLISGFREFFEGVRDPELQHQILGWSNPAPLDQPFNPELIDQHMVTVMERLHRRRLRLLMDPVHTEDSNARRADQVDALYAFPNGLSRIMSRLKRYLEMVFVAGAWSARPLFLRGIYFTSSMREGSALDEELSEMLGVSVDTLPDGHVWAEDRAYFLRDLFVSKIFNERGLVTRATNARKNQRMRRAAVLIAALASVLILFLFTWLGGRSLEKSLGPPRDYYVSAAHADNWTEGRWNPIVLPQVRGLTEYEYLDSTEVGPQGEARMTLADFYPRFVDQTTRKIHIPWVFRFAATLGTDVDTDRAKAHREILQSGVLDPLVEACRHKMARDKGGWTPQATAALVQLLRLETHLAHAGLVGRIELDPMFKYVLMDPQYAKYKETGLEALDSSLNWTFDSDRFAEDHRQWAWLCRSLDAGSRDSHRAVYIRDEEDKILGGVSRFIRHWSALSEQTGDDAVLLRLLEEIFPALRTELGQYKQAEETLLQLPGDVLLAGADTGPADLKELRRVQQVWKDERFKALTEARTKLDGRLGELRGQLKALTHLVAVDPGAAGWVGTAYDRVFSVFAERKKSTFNVLLEALPADGAAEGTEQEKWLGEVRREIEKAQQALEEGIRQEGLAAELKTLDRVLLVSVPLNEEVQQSAAKALGDGALAEATEKGRRWTLYETRFAIYGLADAQIKQIDEPLAPAALYAAIGGAEKDIRQAHSAAKSLWVGHEKAYEPPEGSVLATMEGFTDFAFNRLATRGQIYDILHGVLTAQEADADVIEAQVALAAKAAEMPVLNSLPMTRLIGEESSPLLPAYHPATAARVLQGWRAVGHYIHPREEDPKVFVLERETLSGLFDRWKGACDEYVADYYKFWTVSVPAYLDVETVKDWAEYRRELQKVSARLSLNVRRGLAKWCEEVRAALEAMRPFASAGHRSKFTASIGALTEAREKLEERFWRDDSEEVLDKWINLPENVTGARQAVLALAPSRFVGRYIPFIAEEDDPVVRRYMLGLAMRGLSVLADESQVIGRESWEQLKAQYAVFPLVAPRATDPGTENVLTARQLARAQDLLKQIGYRRKRQDETELAAKTIGQGGVTSYSAVNAKLLLLRELQLAGREKELIEMLRKVAFALSSVEQREARVAILPGEDQPSKGFFRYWAGGIQLAQGGAQGKTLVSFADAAMELGKVRYGPEAAPLQVRIFQYPGEASTDKPRRALTIEGPWAPIRLLHAAQRAGTIESGATHAWKAAERRRGGIEWYVDLTVDRGADRSERTLRLAVTFPAELPRIEDWPKRSDFINADAE